MSAFIVEVEGVEDDVSRWLGDVQECTRCSCARSVSVGEMPAGYARVRAYLSGPDAPHCVARAALQDILALCKRTLRRHPFAGVERARPDVTSPISWEELACELSRIAEIDTATNAGRFLEVLATHEGTAGEDKAVRKVSRLVILTARDAEAADERAGRGPRRSAADVMWSALADRLEADVVDATPQPAQVRVPASPVVGRA